MVNDEGTRHDQTTVHSAVTVGVAAALGGLVFWVAHRSLIDDTYITLSYARNLAVDGTWGLLPGLTANSATSPLNVLVLAGAITVLRPLLGVSSVAALGLVYVVCAAVAALAWSRIGVALRLPWWCAPLGTALLVLNPFVVSSIGLEPMLWSALLGLLLLTAVRGRPVWFGLVAGLVVLARLDLIIEPFPVAAGASGGDTPKIRR